MGKKGRMSCPTGRSDGQGKWASNEFQRSIDSSLRYARSSAYDYNLIEARRELTAAAGRRKLIFPHLKYLVGERVRDDVIETTEAFHVSLSSNAVHIRNNMIRTSSAGDRSDTKQRELKEDRNKLYSSIYKRLVERDHGSNGRVKSLVDICIANIAKSLSLHHPEDVKYVLCTATPEQSKLFNLWSCTYKTLDDAHVRCIANDYVDELYLGSNITDVGVRDLVEHMDASSRKRLTELESWESIHISSIDLTMCGSIRHIYLLECTIAPSSLNLLRVRYVSLRKLTLFDVTLLRDWDHPLDPIVFCLQLLEVFSNPNSGFAELEEIEFYHCSWMCLAAMRLWCQAIASNRIRIHTSSTAVEQSITSDSKESGAVILHTTSSATGTAIDTTAAAAAAAAAADCRGCGPISISSSPSSSSINSSSLNISSAQISPSPPSSSTSPSSSSWSSSSSSSSSESSAAAGRLRRRPSKAGSTRASCVQLMRRTVLLLLLPPVVREDAAVVGVVEVVVVVVVVEVLAVAAAVAPRPEERRRQRDA